MTIKPRPPRYFFQRAHMTDTIQTCWQNINPTDYDLLKLPLQRLAPDTLHRLAQLAAESLLDDPHLHVTLRRTPKTQRRARP